MDNNNLKHDEFHWHALEIDAVLKNVGSNLSGITSKEASSRQKSLGYNEIAATKTPNLLQRFLRQFHNTLIYTLLASAIISVFLERFVDSSVILGVILLNAIFGAIQEGKAEEALKAIRKTLASMAHVLRDGNPSSIHSRLLVPGDIVLLQTGDKIPADLRLIETNNLQIQEALLTGESIPVEKNTSKISQDASLMERTSMAYNGTLVSYGRGKGVVVATGANTEIGRISTLVVKEQAITTPLLKQINSFGRFLTLGILAVAAIIFLVGFLVWHEPFTTLFMGVVGIIVAAIPEGLPAIMTIIFAIGVTRMAKHNAIIRRLPAVETMGAVTTICTDKTGTLTLNELTVQEIMTTSACYTVSPNSQIDDGQNFNNLITASILCNEAVLTQNDKGGWYFHGDPLDQALLSFAAKIGINIEETLKNSPRTSILPFEAYYKMMATLHHNGSNNGFIYVKGAPEQVLNICDFQIKDQSQEPIDLKYWHDNIHKMTTGGQRVIAIAFRQTYKDMSTLNFKDIINSVPVGADQRVCPKAKFIFLGLFGLLDPPREESKISVAKCYSAGLAVKMITGDHVLTASNIAKYVGIKNPDKILTGKELETLEFEELCKVVNEVNVYARTSPEDKLRLVTALKATGNVVAMTGDGVNDIPAILQADIGIAMGKKGTEAAKDAASMVLTDDNFATITYAIEAGRTIYDNLRKAILFVLPTSIAQSFAVVIAILFNHVLPISPVQILWVNMITSITLSLAMAFEPTEEGVMKRPPRPVNEQFFSPLLIWRTVFVSALFTASAFFLFLFEQRWSSITLDTLRTIVVNMMIIGEAFYLFNCRKIYSSSLNIQTIFGSKAVLIAFTTIILLQLAFTYLGFMQKFFGTMSISMDHWLHILILSVAIFFIVEAEKYIIRFAQRKKRTES